MSPELFTSILDFNQTYATLDASKPLDTGALEELNFLMHSAREASQTETFAPRAQGAIIQLLKSYLTHVPIEKSDVLIFCEFVTHILTPNSFDNTAWKTNIDAIVSLLSTTLVNNLNDSQNKAIPKDIILFGKSLVSINAGFPPITHRQLATLIKTYQTLLPLSPIRRLYNILYLTSELSSTDNILINYQNNILNVLLNEPIENFLAQDLDNSPLLLRSNISWLEQRPDTYIDTYYFLLFLQLYANLQSQTNHNKIQDRLISINRKFTPSKAHFDIMDKIFKTLSSIKASSKNETYLICMAMLENLQQKMKCPDFDKYAQQLKLIKQFSFFIPPELFIDRIVNIHQKMLAEKSISFEREKAFVFKRCAVTIIDEKHKQIRQLATQPLNPTDHTSDELRQQIAAINLEIDEIKFNVSEYFTKRFNNKNIPFIGKSQTATFWKNQLTAFEKEVNQLSDRTALRISSTIQQVPLTKTNQHRLFPTSATNDSTNLLTKSLQFAIKNSIPKDTEFQIKSGRHKNMLYFLIKSSPAIIEKLKMAMGSMDVMSKNKKLNLKNPGMLLVTQIQAWLFIRKTKENIKATEGNGICQNELDYSPQQSRKM